MSETKQQQIDMLKRLLSDARSERDRLEGAVRWALGETVKGAPGFMSGYEEGGPRYWWRRQLRVMAFGSGR